MGFVSLSNAVPGPSLFVPVAYDEAQKYCNDKCGRHSSIVSEHVSVVIPCYHQSDTVVRAIASTKEQGVSNIIVVDDDPPGNDCFKKIATSPYNKSVDFILNPQNIGLAKSRNRGLEDVATEFVVFLDADDTLTCEYLHESVETARRTGADMIVANQIILRRNETALRWNIRSVVSMTKALGHGPFPVPNVVRTSVLRRLGGFPVEMAYGKEDHALWIEMLDKKVSIFVSHAVGSCYRVHDGMMRSASYKTFSHDMIVSKFGHIGGAVRSCTSLDKLSSKLGYDYVRRLGALDATRCIFYAWMLIASINAKVDKSTVESLVEVGWKMCTEEGTASERNQFQAVTRWRKESTRSLLQHCLENHAQKSNDHNVRTEL